LWSRFAGEKKLKVKIVEVGEKEMGFDLSIFEDDGLEAGFLDWLTKDRASEIQRHFGKMWDYYSNPQVETAGTGAGAKAAETGRCYVQAQEAGLPARITGILRNPSAGVFGGQPIGQIQRKEIVIENDIAWRINAAVDFLFGKPVSLVSKSPDAQTRKNIEAVIKSVFEANGGVGFFQDMAVLGGVYGFVDCFVRPGEEIYQNFTSQSLQNFTLEAVLQKAQAIELELIEAPRALPILDENNYKKILYYVQHFYQKKNAVKRRNGFLKRLLGIGSEEGIKSAAVTEIVSDKAWQRYEDGELAFEGENLWGFVPLVHIQNLAQPFYYEGISDVEPLMPLQDELNTRLSDRAHRITMQAFKMYLGKGIEGFDERPVSPGRMWCTDNPDATIEEFGGDAGSESENLHIDQIREAMDKTSSVTPIVAGVIRGKIGNLTSAVALKLMLMGMLSKTERKKFTYGEGIKKICSMVLEILDKANIYKTNPEDRAMDVIFPSALPENLMEKLQEAQIKKELGVPGEQILRELGY
jgi:hypothetical protein